LPERVQVPLIRHARASAGRPRRAGNVILAEVVAKVLLLARDHELKDPTILEQLRS
jgi:hypothetical protein